MTDAATTRELLDVASLDQSEASELSDEAARRTRARRTVPYRESLRSARYLAPAPLERLLSEMRYVLEVLTVHAPTDSGCATLQHWCAQFETALEAAARVSEWLTVTEVAALADKAESTVRWRLAKKQREGKLTKSMKRGRDWEIHRDELETLWVA
jgi:hypothetical protein